MLLFFVLALLSSISSSRAEEYVFNNKTFSKAFSFGVATSAYQVEGAWNEDGKGLNIWDVYTHRKPSIIEDGSTGDKACDSYHKFETDIAMLKDLGVKHYRFSISWARILPNGRKGLINTAGVAYYKKIITLLKENNITPLITLYHWDLPQALEDQGGFLNASIALWFSDYARLAFKFFGDEVKHWITFNEATFICVGGYGSGFYAPGKHGSAVKDYICAHNLLRAHAAAWHVYDKEFRKTQGGNVSMVHNINYYHPATNSTADIETSERRLQFELGWWANPIYNGDYPEVMKARVAYRSKLQGLNESRLPEFTEEEKKLIKGTSDFFSVNTYASSYIKDVPEPNVKIVNRATDIKYALKASTEKNGAWGLPLLFKWIQKHYNNPPILITENGLAVNIKKQNDSMDDDNRIFYVKSYLSRIRDVIDEGANVLGYTLWSLMDNMEWSTGYDAKFGIYYVDFTSPNRTRTPKKSAGFYKKVCHTYCLVDKCDS